MLDHLETLYLNDNQLWQLPEVITQLDSLQVLALENNSLGILPWELGQMPNLQILTLSNNPIVSDIPLYILNGEIDDLLSYIQENSN